MVKPLIINTFSTTESAFMAEAQSLWNGPASRIAGRTADVDLLQRIIAPPDLNQFTDNSGHDPPACEILTEPVADVSNPIDPVQEVESSHSGYRII